MSSELSKKIRVVALTVLFFCFPKPIFAAWDSRCKGPDIAEHAGLDVATIRGIICILERLIKPLPGLVVLGGLIMIILGGVKIMTGGGDTKAQSAGYSQISWGIIGVLAVPFAWVLVYIIQSFTGANLSNFGF